MIIDNTCYFPTDNNVWKGRVDGNDKDQFRWHQIISCIDLNQNRSLEGAVVFLGFCSDEGVRRNQGRVGARKGPEAFRKILTNVPVHIPDRLRLVDAGDVVCDDEDLEKAQHCLSTCVQKILELQGFPILLGGGHEITFPHFLGHQHATQKSVGVINLDAHFDNRPLVNGKGNSGTGFFQIANQCEKMEMPFNYLAIGIQEISNTKSLFEIARTSGSDWILANDIHQHNLGEIIDRVLAFSKQVDSIYLTVDLDVFNSVFAPGVSSAAFGGIIPDHNFQILFDTIIGLPNLRSIDLAELNPDFDIDNRTAKLGVDLLFKFLLKYT